MLRFVFLVLILLLCQIKIILYKYLVSSQFSLLFVVVCLSFDLYGGGCLSWALPIKLFTIGQHNQHYHLPAKWKWNHILKRKETICAYYIGPKYQNMYTKHKIIYNERLKLPKTSAWNNFWQLSSKVPFDWVLFSEQECLASWKAIAIVFVFLNTKFYLFLEIYFTPSSRLFPCFYETNCCGFFLGILRIFVLSRFYNNDV